MCKRTDEHRDTLMAMLRNPPRGEVITPVMIKALTTKDYYDGPLSFYACNRCLQLSVHGKGRTLRSFKRVCSSSTVIFCCCDSCVSGTVTAEARESQANIDVRPWRPILSVVIFDGRQCRPDRKIYSFIVNISLFLLLDDFRRNVGCKNKSNAKLWGKYSLIEVSKCRLS